MSSAIIKSEEEIKSIAQAGRIVASCHQRLGKMLAVGMKTKEIDHFIDWYLGEQGAIPAQKGYKGYPFSSCISVNDVACHGFPSDYELQAGDIVTIDIVADVEGWKADSAWTYTIGNVSDEARRLVRSSKAALLAGLKAAKAGNQLSAIGQAIEEQAERDGFKVITAFAGHGIGKQLHEPPQVLHASLPQPNFILQEGMVITIEPILSAGSTKVYIAPDGWTARTVDHALTAQFEHTIVITKGAPLLLTALPDKQSRSKSSAARQNKAKPGKTKSSTSKLTTSKSSGDKSKSTTSPVARVSRTNTNTGKSSAAGQGKAKPDNSESAQVKASTTIQGTVKPGAVKLFGVRPHGAAADGMRADKWRADGVKADKAREDRARSSEDKSQNKNKDHNKNHNKDHNKDQA